MADKIPPLNCTVFLYGLMFAFHGNFSMFLGEYKFVFPIIYSFAFIDPFSYVSHANGSTLIENCLQIYYFFSYRWYYFPRDGFPTINDQLYPA